MSAEVEGALRFGDLVTLIGKVGNEQATLFCSLEKISGLVQEGYYFINIIFIAFLFSFVYLLLRTSNLELEEKCTQKLFSSQIKCFNRSENTQYNHL